jgi:acetylornithine deacetylase/succinyl-diaminopimelate desuccinylase-like protein
MYAALLSVKACQDNGLPHPRIYVTIEGSEESSEDDLIFYIDKFIKDKVFEHTLDLVVALDSFTINAQTFSATASLRGIINFDLKVEAFKDNLHSGNSGMYADTFTVATQLISRIEDKNTYLLKSDFQTEIPAHRMKELRELAEITDPTGDFQTIGDIQRVPSLFVNDDVDQKYHSLLNGSWSSVLSVIGASGLPECKIAGNCLRKSTTLTLSIRTPPNADSNQMLKGITEILTYQVPFNYKVTIERPDVANGWDSKEHTPDLQEALNYGVDKAYGSAPIFIGCGGAIPFAGILGEKFPEANFLVTGSSLPDSNAHGPNENLDLPSTKNMITALALMLSKY